MHNHYAKIRAEIPAAVRLIAVSKKQDVAAIQQVYAAGCRDFAENYLQEGLAKIKQMQDLSIRWHFIGRIQSNKIKDIAEYFDVVHTLDRLEVATKLNAACHKINKVMPVFIQVNLDGETQKSGVFPAHLPALVAQISAFAHLDLQGFMLIPALGHATSFSDLRLLRDQIEQQVGILLPRLSMGMSQDYALAIAEGATDVRIGEAIFGAR